MKLSKLTKEGIDEFIYFLDNIHDIDVQKKRMEILSLSKEINNTNCIVLEEFPILKMDVAKYLFELLQNITEDMLFDKGLWCWLSLYYFDAVCIKDKQEMYKPGDVNRWVPIFDHHQKYHRHLLASPWGVYRRYKGDQSALSAILSGNVQIHGDLLEQLASRQEIISCKPIMQTATRLYFDDKTDLAKKGSGGAGPGSPRRLAIVHLQLSRTYDFYEMSVDDILNILPKEFDRFLKE